MHAPFSEPLHIAIFRGRSRAEGLSMVPIITSAIVHARGREEGSRHAIRPHSHTFNHKANLSCFICVLRLAKSENVCRVPYKTYQRLGEIAPKGIQGQEWSFVGDCAEFPPLMNDDICMFLVGSPTVQIGEEKILRGRLHGCT